MVKQKGQNQPAPSNQFANEQPPDLPAIDPTAPSFWNDQPNIRNINSSNNESTIDDTNIDVPCLGSNSPGNNTTNTTNSQPSGNNPSLGQSPNLLARPTSPGGQQPSLQGVKVPDENLTPEQRQHRESQLATLGKLHLMLFEHKNELGEITQVATSTPGSSSNVPPVTSTASGQCSSKVDWNTTLNPFLTDGKNKVIKFTFSTFIKMFI